VTQALDRVRQGARLRKKEPFTRLLHHINIDTLRTASTRSSVKPPEPRNSTPGPPHAFSWGVGAVPRFNCTVTVIPVGVGPHIP
jgi:hypothetical protein